MEGMLEEEGSIVAHCLHGSVISVIQAVFHSSEQPKLDYG